MYLIFEEENNHCVYSIIEFEKVHRINLHIKKNKLKLIEGHTELIL